MSNEEIQKFFDRQQANSGKEDQVKIEFKKRNTIYGVFIKGNDYAELSSKNFWRIVTAVNLDQWKQSKDMNLARIFNGSEFSRLTLKSI